MIGQFPIYVRALCESLNYHFMQVIQREPWEHIKDADIKKAAASFRGEIWQVPPMFSAIKVRICVEVHDNLYWISSLRYVAMLTDHSFFFFKIHKSIFILKYVRKAEKLNMVQLKWKSKVIKLLGRVYDAVNRVDKTRILKFITLNTVEE